MSFPVRLLKYITAARSSQVFPACFYCLYRDAAHIVLFVVAADDIGKWILGEAEQAVLLAKRFAFSRPFCLLIYRKRRASSRKNSKIRNICCRFVNDALYKKETKKARGSVTARIEDAWGNPCVFLTGHNLQKKKRPFCTRRREAVGQKRARAKIQNAGKRVQPLRPKQDRTHGECVRPCICFVGGCRGARLLVDGHIVVKGSLGYDGVLGDGDAGQAVTETEGASFDPPQAVREDYFRHAGTGFEGTFFYRL